MLIAISHTSSNCFFCPTDRPKPKDSSFTIMHDKEKAIVATLDYVQISLSNIWYLFFFHLSHLAFSPSFSLLSSSLSSCAPHISLHLSLFPTYFGDELRHVRNSYQPACTLQHIRQARGKEIKGMRVGRCRKGGQGTQVNLLHRQILAADIHPVSFTLVSARISANASAFMNLGR